MKKLWLIIALGSAAACIEWPSEEVLQERFCMAHPTDQACAPIPDAGGVDSGVDAGMDAGEDAGVDAGMDAGSDGGTAGTREAWNLAWRELHGHTALFVVGDQNGGSLVSHASGDTELIAFNSFGQSAPPIPTTTGNPPTAAYERDTVLTVGWGDRQIYVFRRASSGFNPITAEPDPGFATTAMDLYPLSDGGLAVAAYGNVDGGLAVHAFSAAPSRQPQGSTVMPCLTTRMNPQRILPSPDGGPGVVVGNVDGVCLAPLDGINNSGNGFVARFGGTLSMPDGYVFAALPTSAMALGIVQNDLWVAYEMISGNRLAIGRARPAAPLISTPLLAGTLTPVELIDNGSGAYLVGHGSGEISFTDGGARTQMNGTDVFIARLGPTLQQVEELQVFVAPGDQTVVGAVWTAGRLVMGGNCSLIAEGLCQDAGVSQSWLAGFEPNP